MVLPVTVECSKRAHTRVVLVPKWRGCRKSRQPRIANRLQDLQPERANRRTAAEPIWAKFSLLQYKSAVEGIFSSGRANIPTDQSRIFKNGPGFSTDAQDTFDAFLKRHPNKWSSRAFY